MAKRYSKKLADEIVSLVQEGIYSVSAICRIAGIGRKTFYRWRETKNDFSRALSDAEQQCRDELRAKARQILKRKLEGYTQIVSRTVYVPSDDDPSQLVIKQHVVTEKHCEPDMRLVMQLLEKNNSVAEPPKATPATMPHIAVKVNEEKIERDLNLVCIAKDTVADDNEKQPPATGYRDAEKELPLCDDKSGDREETVSLRPEETIYGRQQRLKERLAEKLPTRVLPPPLRGIPYR